MKVITIAQQKGGTGKTTTAAAIGQGLTNAGAKVLYIDLDPQGNLSGILRADQGKANALEMLTGKVTAKQATQQLPQGGAIIPATPLLAGADATINQTGREYLLKTSIKPMGAIYDYCIVDTPPALGVLTVAALTAADVVIVPSNPDYMNLQATQNMIATIAGIKATTNTGLKSFIVITRDKPRQTLAQATKSILEQIAQQGGVKVLKTTIRESAAIPQAQALGKDVYTHKHTANGATDYAALTKELIATLKK